MSTAKYPSQSPQLTSFYQAYREWLTIGSPDGEPFDRFHGLCDNVRYFSKWCFPGWAGLCGEMGNELTAQFKDAGLHNEYPFNDGKLKNYATEYRCDQNPARIAWVLDHV